MPQSLLPHRTERAASPARTVLLLETIVETRVDRPRETELIDLVCTGPEAHGGAARDTGVVVRELFGGAKEEVLVAGFAVYQGREVFARLAERMVEVPGLRVRLFLDVRRHPGDTTLESELLRRFARRFREQEWPSEVLPEVFYDPRSLTTESKKRSSLHAKCVVVDRETAFVSSANFTEAAQVRNIEVGVLIRSKRFAGTLADHFEGLVGGGVLVRLGM